MEHVHNNHVLTSIDTQSPTQHFIKPNDNTTTLHDLGIQQTNDNFTNQKRKQLRNLLVRNANIFSTDLSQLPVCSVSKHTIHTGDAPQQRQRSYKHSSAVRREIDKQTADMLANAIIEPSDSV